MQSQHIKKRIVRKIKMRRQKQKESKIKLQWKKNDKGMKY